MTILTVTQRGTGFACTCDVTGRRFCPQHMDEPRRRLKTVLYISGPMRGYPDFNFPAFARAEQLLKDRGYLVISPHRMDLDLGLTPTRMAANGAPTGQQLVDIVRRDIDAVFACDGVCTLKGWQRSIGAIAEVAVAKFLQKPILPLEP